jgi:flagellar basal-body rod protein FlgB
MGEINDTAIVAALRRQMTLAVAKQSTAAGNLANANTPNYRARAVKFTDALDEKLGISTADSALRTTHAGHLTGTGEVSANAVEIADAPARRDGNTVQVDRELLTMTQAAGQFSAAQTVLAAKFRLVRFAISEGR